MSESILRKKSYSFSLKAVELCRQLMEQREYIMSKQMMRSCTSVGANIREATNAESKRDFIHKLAISQKECDESLFWIELLHESKWIDEGCYLEMSHSGSEILKMLRSTILTMKQRYKL